MPDTSPELIARMQLRADPLADDTISAIIGHWRAPLEHGLPDDWDAQKKKLEAVSRVFADWTSNEKLATWTPPADLAPDIATPLLNYVQASRTLPAWADHAKIKRAEQLFMDHGVLSVTLLFCSSLPECYVIPDLSAVLHATGQLDKHVDYRVRATGAMIFPVMMHGGLTDPTGAGVAQVFKVRLIHATIRNLILRRSPQEANALLNESTPSSVPPLENAEPQNMYRVLFAHGWSIGNEGVPCDQLELAYTLLTFSYVFLRSMRTLGIGFAPADEEAYLHAWNVAGSMLGIEREMMVDTMDEAAALFARMQAHGRNEQTEKPVVPDPRPKLGNALVNAMANVIPFTLLKPFPLLMTRYLVGKQTSTDLGLAAHAPLLSHALFIVLLLLARSIDKVARLLFPTFSIARFFTRILGYRLISRLLMGETRKLKLPEHALKRVDTVVANWGNDQQAPRWLNKVEDWVTIRGSWKKPV